MESIMALPYGSIQRSVSSSSCSSLADENKSSFFGSKCVLSSSSCRIAVAKRRGLGLLVVRAKGKRSFSNMQGRMQQSRPRPTLPKLDDDDNPKFLLFVKSKNVPMWYPLSIVTGGTTAKIMLAAMKNEWGKKLYQGTLTRNLASVAYKDEKAMRAAAIKAYSILKEASALEYGYKVVDRSNPNAALFTSDVIKIPPKEELKSVVDKAKDFLGKNFSTMKESFGNISDLSFDASEGASPPLQEGNPTKSK
ncbi:hypothetical protein O6H91_01G093400 [Diphasiastrum complanatum]|uniref:Uncharacterized protein n=1 Tax=Diphasiastrum complanatum TaxID=34168 RepID=A0ACC2ETJ7_DIPCM|nr:hypothetical protein O6H91_01G093400 [Diphasiastrum complanatum]